MDEAGYKTVLICLYCYFHCILSSMSALSNAEWECYEVCGQEGE